MTSQAKEDKYYVAQLKSAALKSFETDYFKL